MRENLQHPMEKAAQNALVSNGSFRKILQVFDEACGRFTELATLPLYHYPITQETAPRVYKLYRKALARLEIAREYPLYAALGYSLSADTIGTESDCAILLNHTCIAQMSDEQLTALLGQQLGHILYGHVKYMTAFRSLDRIVAAMPKFAALAVDTVKFLFQDWLQYASFTADRAAAIACCKPEPVVQMLLQRMGGYYSQHQAEQLLASLGGLEQPTLSELNLPGKVVFQSMMGQVPFPLGLLRIQQLQQWAQSDQCRQTAPHIYYAALAASGTAVQQADASILALHRAAENGDAKAMGALGMRYLYGTSGVGQELAFAVVLLRQAASLGDAQSQCLLGQLLLDGKIVAKNPVAGQLLLEMAAAQGHPQATQAFQTKFQPCALIPANMLQKLCERHQQRAAVQTCHGMPDQKTRAKLAQSLWIPQTETIAAWEGYLEETCLVAVTSSGLFLCQSPELPKRIPWLEMRKGSSRYDHRHEAGVTHIMIDGVEFRCIDSAKLPGSIFGLVQLIRESIR